MLPLLLDAFKLGLDLSCKVNVWLGLVCRDLSWEPTPARLTLVYEHLSALISEHSLLLGRLLNAQKRFAGKRPSFNRSITVRLSFFLDCKRCLLLGFQMGWQVLRRILLSLFRALALCWAVVEVVEEQDHVRFVFSAKRVLDLVLADLDLELRVLLGQFAQLFFLGTTLRS